MISKGTVETVKRLEVEISKHRGSLQKALDNGDKETAETIENRVKTLCQAINVLVPERKADISVFQMTVGPEAGKWIQITSQNYVPELDGKITIQLVE